MSKKSFKSQASSSRAVPGAFGQPEVTRSIGNFGITSTFGAVPTSSLSCVYEPPDLSNISNPSVVVAIKNLQKKDSTTKSKALEELQVYVLSLAAENGGVEEAILEPWIKLYPRASIDCSRRVRQLAHLVQGQIAVSCGKRIAKYMPQIVSSWLAGLYDNDRTVTRSARESLSQVFTSEEKLKSLWRVYQSAIVEYAGDAVEKETVNTLSDERATSPDDASAKYARVVGAAISMVATVIDETPILDQEKSKLKIDEFLGQEKVWKFASDPDSYLRLAVYRLATTIFTKSRDSLDLGLISSHMLGSSLTNSQVGSAFKYAIAIALLTIKSPDVWTKYYSGSGKKSATRRLCQYLRRGSQGGPPDYWAQIKTLIHHLPLSVLLPEVEGGTTKTSESDSLPGFPLLEAFREGITSQKEPTVNLSSAWNTYLDVCEHVDSFSSNQSSRDQFAQGQIAPLIFQYVSPSTDRLEWTISGPDQLNLCVRALRQILNNSPETFREEWRHLSAKVIEDFQTSLPEKSKDYNKSQDSISAEIARWYTLQAAMLNDESEILHSTMATTLASEVKMCTHTLRERNGKPYSAAAILVHATESLPELVRTRGETQTIITQFAQEDIPKLLLSPSAPQLIATLSRINEITDMRSIYEVAISELHTAPESAAKSNTLKSFISSPFLADSAKIEALVYIVKESLEMAKHGDETHWDLVMVAIGNEAAPSELTDELLADMVNGLSIDDERSACLEGLELTAKRNGQALKAFTMSTNSSSLLSKLLFLTESPDGSVSEKAHNLTIAIEAILSDGKDSAHAIESIIKMINQGIDMAEENSLSIDALVEQAQKLLHQTIRSDLPALVSRLLPNLTQWTAALKPFATQLPNPSMSIMAKLGGALYFIDRETSEVADVQSISRDSDGYSPALRMAWYVVRLLNTTDVFDYTTREQRVVLFRHLTIFTQLATHDISVPGSVLLWEKLDPDTENEISHLIADIQTLHMNWIKDSESLSKELINTTQTQLLEESRGTSASSYYSACAYSMIGSELAELHGDLAQEDLEQLDMIWTSPDIFTKAAHLASASESTLLFKFCSKLLDDLTGHNFHEKTHEGLRQLVYLNCIVDTHEHLLFRIPSQRLIFFVKHLISQAHDNVPGIQVQTEMMKILKVVVTPIKEIYGVFWEELIDLVQRAWAFLDRIGDDEIPLLHASLRLFQQLKRLKQQESNDDLQDAWSEKQVSLDKGLLNLLIYLQDTSDELHDPRKIVNALLARQLKAITLDSTSQALDLYPALASESLALQQSAYEILHKSIPRTQEEVSLDKALRKEFVARLPEELLSLILAAPGLDTLAVASFERSMPATLQSYLLSWKLVYDHWTNSSSMVKADYANCLKDGTYVPILLDFATNLLINRRSKPVNASLFEIDSYNPNTYESPESETHSLLIHIYYLSLKHLPNLSKAWWRDTTSRQTVVSVEAWTEKYISPQIIASELSTISEWAPSQSTSDQPLTIKVSPSAREITASIPIDEQHMQIAIRLPASYPLARVTVDSVHRVAVDEKKWHGWLMTTQGVINFSGSGDEGALIDGLLAWRRNVTATLKGQTECAICYSVVGADRQLPGKRCGTCRNMFHGSCLFRWFKSSNSSSCPLCRNAFNYT